MEHSNHAGLLLLIASWFFNVLASLTKSDITFMLGTIATLLAIIHYVIQIRKNLKQ